LSLRARALRGGAVLTIGQVFGQALAFGRNIIVAQMLSPHDVGVAATLAITWSLVEMLSDVSIDKMLIQAKDGDDVRLQGACQLAMALRGGLLALVLFLLSWPMSALFDLPDQLWAFQCMAIAPLLRGLGHLDMTRLQRDLRFGPSAVADLLPQIVGFLAVIPLAYWLADYRAVLATTLLHAGTYLAASHVMSHRAYRWAWDVSAFRRIAVFGWPLMINGALIFAIGQGDQIAIGASYPKEDLALWANALLLASAPLLVLGKVAVSMALPMLAKCRDDRPTFDSRYELCMQALAWVAALVAIPLILGGGAIMGLIFGPHYAAAGAFVGILAAAQAIRVCRLGVNMAAMSHGETTNPAFANAARLIGVAFAIVAAAQGAPLTTIALAALVGEVASFFAGTWRLHQQGIAGAAQAMLTMLPFAIVLAVAFGIAESGLVSAPLMSIGAALAGLMIGPAVLFFVYPKLRRESRILLRSSQRPALA
jgi:O-antigen/teichoic acid export membrane protein